MFDPKQLLDQVLGTGGQVGSQVKGRLDGMSGSGGFASGAAVGGLLGVLLGSKSARKGVLGYGGAAAVGALALHAYQAWQRGQSVQGTVPMGASQAQAVPPTALPHATPAAD